MNEYNDLNEINHIIDEFNSYVIDDDVVKTTDINEAIWLLEDGKMLSGEFCDGVRGLDHNSLLSSIGCDYVDASLLFNLIRLVPETRQALYIVGSDISEYNYNLLNDGGYRLVPLSHKGVD